MMSSMDIEGSSKIETDLSGHSVAESSTPVVDSASEPEKLVIPENITHPEYDSSVISAIELMCNRRELFNRLPHLKQTLLLDVMTAFGEQEETENSESIRKVRGTLMWETATPEIFKSIYYHYLHLNNMSRTTTVAEALKQLIRFTSKFLKKEDRKPVMFFRRMIHFEHQMEKSGEYGRHTIDSTGGVYGEAIDISSLEGRAGDFLKLGLGKAVLELLHNQVHLAGVEPMTSQELRNSRKKQRQTAAKLLQHIESEGWDDLLDGHGKDLNDNPETRKPTSRIKLHSHDITTILAEKSITDEASLLVRGGRKLVSNVVERFKKKTSMRTDVQNMPAQFAEFDLEKNGLAAISVRLISKDGTVFVDTDAKHILSISNFELEKIIQSPKNFSHLKWRPVAEMDTEADENNWPMMILSMSDSGPNPFTTDQGTYKYRGARGRGMLHLHYVDQKVAHDKQKQNLFVWSGHWRINGATQNEFIRVIKKTFISETNRKSERALKFKEKKQSVPIDSFAIYPPLPSKDFAYQETKPASKEISKILRGEGVETVPNNELTRARLESLGLTDLELRSSFDGKKMQKKLDAINNYWNKPIVNDLFALMSFDENPGVDKNNQEYVFKTKKGLDAFQFQYSLDQIIANQHPEIASFDQPFIGTNLRYPAITIHDPSAMEAERAKIKKEIRNFLSPQISKLHIFSIIAGLDGSTGYCVIPKPQEQNGLGIALAATLSETIKQSLEKYLQSLHAGQGQSASELKLAFTDIRSLLSAFLSTSLDQTYTRLGISPLAVIDDMTAEYTSLTEQISGMSAPELRAKTYLVSQLSELPADEPLDDGVDNDWFNTALSGRRETMARSWGIKGDNHAWRIHLSSPDFFEKVNFAHLSQEMIADTAATFATWTQPFIEDGLTLTDEPRSSIELTSAETTLFAKLAYRLWHIRSEAGAKDIIPLTEKLAGFFDKKSTQSEDSQTNAVRLDQFMKLLHGLSAEQLKKIFDDVPELKSLHIEKIRENLLHGFKVLTVAALRTKQKETEQLAVAFTEEVARLARFDNFVQFLHSYTEEQFHTSFEETRGMSLEKIREAFADIYVRFEKMGLLERNAIANRPLSDLEVHTIMMANVADSKNYSSARLKYELALSIPVQNEVNPEELLAMAQEQ